jgi:site-specific DNA recombinase
MTAPGQPEAARGRKRRQRPVPGFGGAPAGPRRVAVYLRRSTDDEHQPFSISAQQTALTAYVTTQPGWALVATYSDDASGATTRRPGLQQALRAARDGRFDVLLVYRVDRFSRRLSDLLDLLRQLEEAGVAFASVTEPFDTSASIGRMLVQLLGVFAEFERETIIDRVAKGMAAKAANGKWPGGHRPYGYRPDPQTHKLTPHPDEAPHLREIFRLYTDERLGTRAVAGVLNRRGVPNRSAKPWSGHTISRIIANPAYAGDLAYGEVYVQDAHRPLISRATWQKALAIAAARVGEHSQRAASPADYHLTALITCPQCGHSYVGTSATGRTRTYRYYTCFSRARYGPHGCPAPRLPADETDAAILQALCDFYAHSTHLIQDAVTRAQQHHRDGHASQRAEHEAILAQIKHNAAAMDRYHAAFENGTMDDATAGQRLKTLHDQIAQLTVRAEALTQALSDEPAPPPPGVIADLQVCLADAIASGTPAERKAAIEALVAEVRITDHGLIPVFRIPSPRPSVPGETETATTEPAVRTMLSLVGRLGLEPRTGGL